MRVVETLMRPSADDVAAIVEFVEAVSDQTGHRPLSDHLWLDLRAGGADGFVAVTVRDETGILALAQISAANDSSALETVGRPGVGDVRLVVDDAAETALDAFAALGGGRLLWWVDEPNVDDERFAETHGFKTERTLFEMRRPLPVGERADVPTRAFRPGADDEAWIAVNNRAFAGHGEQGGWTLDTLRLREAEPWFEPDGFRVHEIGGRIAAFCWTKLHRDVDPVLGEIYVIAVDPDFHGRGLGRQLTLAGLDSITDRGVAVANLYVDAGNTGAVHLYDRLGFVIHRRRRAYATHRSPTDQEHR